MAFTQGKAGAINAALGQYVTKKVVYTSDVMLSGKVLKLSVATYYDGSTPPTSPAFQILYPASPGTYDFTKLNSKNFKAKLKVIDAQKFEIQYSFFATSPFAGWNNCINSKALNLSANQNYTLGIYISSTEGEILTTIPIEINTGCDRVEFVESGFTPNVDLPIQIKIDGSVNNNFYAALIRTDDISDTLPIYPGLFRSYARIGNAVIDYDDFDSDYFTDGNGFNEYDNESIAFVTLKGSLLKHNASYQLLIIYFQDGEWKSCLSELINQAATNNVIQVTGLQAITDDNGNTATNCVSRVSNLAALDLLFEVDQSEYLNQLDQADLDGDFDTYFRSAKAFTAGTPDAVGGLSLALENPSLGVFQIEDFTYSKTGTIFVIIQLEMQYLTHTDFVNVPFQINYDALESEILVNVLDSENQAVNEICEGEEYTLSQEINCDLLVSYNAGTYQAIETLDFDDIPLDTVACYKMLCLGSQSPCDCDDVCGTLTAYTTINTSIGDPYIVNISLGDPDLNGTLEIYYKSFVGATITDEYLTIDNWINFIDHNILQHRAIITKIRFTQFSDNCVFESIDEIDCQGLTPVDGILATVNNPEVTLYAVTCDCEEIESDVPLYCENNKANIIFECDEDTGIVTLDVNTIFDSPVEDESFLVSFDGGISFIPAPSSISDEPSILVTYDAVFADGCPPLHIEQFITCIEIEDKSNIREIDLVNAGNELIINITDSFESTALQDTLKVSLDNGLTFTEYDLLGAGYTPITLTGNEKIVVESNTIFEDGENDFYLIKTLNLNLTLPPCESDYSEYTLTATYNEETSVYTVVKSGNETLLSDNDLRWTIGGGNPHDNNNSGVLYAVPVNGQGLFIASWRIKLPNCAAKIITAVAFGEPCVNFCEPIKVEFPNPIPLTFPTSPLEVCLVECCEGVDLEIVCIDHVLTVSGAPEGSTISWTGPNGYTADGNDVEIEDEGTYFVTVVDNSGETPCTSTASYFHDEPEAGTPIGNPIIVG